jgi:hypothetical protein
VFLHPLRKYPGPTLWCATRLPWCWYQSQGTLNQKLLELHLKYGQTVRVAPNELSFTSDEAWKTIYGPRTNEMAKDPVFSLHTPSGVQSRKSPFISLPIAHHIRYLDCRQNDPHSPKTPALSCVFREGSTRTGGHHRRLCEYTHGSALCRSILRAAEHGRLVYFY